jgi:beta-galactosidase
MPEFAIGDDDFLLDGSPFRVLSGALHYFRVHPALWADRIHKARLMGLNTIETYVAWNAHSPLEGEFATSGGLDLGHFLELVAAEGMYAIVRPGPYICAEWDNGGLPAWLFSQSSVGVRRSEPVYLAAVEQYLRQVFAIVEPLQVTHGGPVILVQVENEYGAYGDDKDYLRTLTAITRDAGITVPLTSIDQPTDEMLANGSIPELHKTASFGSRSLERLATLREHQPTGPLMCAEFWDGWFDHWGAHHHTTSVEQTTRDLEELLAAGASVNLYMFHGGTNFGFTNGANDKGVYQPLVTSYDYDAPLDEAGNPTPKYWAYREILSRYSDVPEERPAERSDAPTPATTIESSRALTDVAEQLGEWTAHDTLPSLDSLGHYSGFALYRTAIDAEAPGVLAFGEVRDRAQLFFDGTPIGVLSRDHHDRQIALPHARGSVVALVEDQGRVNYGPRIGEAKGLIGEATVGGVPITDWETLALDLGPTGIATVTSALRTAPRTSVPLSVTGPAFVLATFESDASRDLFLDTSSWGKGVAWINGFPLGRYWQRGPQETLYIPAPTLVDGRNEIVLFELSAVSDPCVRFVAGPELGHTEF